MLNFMRNYKNFILSLGLIGSLSAGSVYLAHHFSSNRDNQNENIRTKEKYIRKISGINPKKPFKNKSIKIPKSSFEKTENSMQLYAKLYETLKICEEIGDYGKFIDSLNEINLQYKNPKIPMTLIDEDGPSGRGLEFYIKNDKDALLSLTLSEGQFLDSAILAYELGYPEEISKLLYEKRKNLYNDERIIEPYSKETISRLAGKLWIGYINYALSRAHRDENLNLPQEYNERLSDIINNYSDSVRLSSLEMLIHTIISKDNEEITPEIAQSVSKKMERQKSSFYAYPSLYDLEDIVSGHIILKDDGELQNIIQPYLNQVFTEEIKKTSNLEGEEKDMNHVYLLNRLDKFKPYISQESYDYWNDRLKIE